MKSSWASDQNVCWKLCGPWVKPPSGLASKAVASCAAAKLRQAGPVDQGTAPVPDQPPSADRAQVLDMTGQGSTGGTGNGEGTPVPRVARLGLSPKGKPEVKMPPPSLPPTNTEQPSPYIDIKGSGGLCHWTTQGDGNEPRRYRGGVFL